jgi:CubicO group peptidase (beta-lactamase class C family)
MRSTTTFVVAAGLALSGVCAVPVHAQPPTFPVNAELDGLITNKMAEAGFMGLAAAVIVKRQVVWMKGYGFADWQRPRPFTPNTIMNVGSIAKPFTGVAMMRAVQEGKLSLDGGHQHLPAVPGGQPPSSTREDHAPAPGHAHLRHHGPAGANTPTSGPAWPATSWSARWASR